MKSGNYWEYIPVKMSKREKSSRIHSRKALDRVVEILEKYPSGILDVSSVNEEARAWVEKKIQQLRECLKCVKFPLKPFWWENLRLTRNKTAHQKEDFSDSEFTSLCKNIFSNINKIKSDLELNINNFKQQSKKKRKFENFGSEFFGSEQERKQLVDAVENQFNPIEPKDLEIDFPNNKFAKELKTVTQEILQHQNVKNYVASHNGLSENIQTDILEWLEKVNAHLEKENPFIDEAIFIEEQKRKSTEEIASDISDEKSKIKYHYKRIPSVSESKRGNIDPSSLDFDFYKNAFNEQKKIKKNKDEKEIISWKSKEKLEILQRNFLSDMEKNLIERKNKWEQERIEKARKEFLEELYKKIEKFIRLERLLSLFINHMGRLWDLSNGIFEESGFEIFDTFAKLLENDESLQELAKILGKQSRAQSTFEKELRDKVVIKSEWKPKNAYRGEINGLKYSNDISCVLPSELALLRNPATKKLFQLKFAQKQLLSYNYRSKEEIEKERVEQEEVSVEKKEPKGPIIVCVDTSGSMQGTPENIAKTVTFALSKIAIEEERKCYLISFSTEIETLDLSDFSEGNSISKLVSFLRKSFNGGTDATPALKHSLEMLQKNAYKNADVLMISDFVMDTLPTDLVNSIEEEKKKNTCFYSLVIGSSGNQNTIKAFNHNWLYDMSNPNATRHLVEQLHEIKMR